MEIHDHEGTDMIGNDSIGHVAGKTVYDPDGEKIGSASEVYLDDETDLPEWVTVRTGLFGTRESFVPLRDAALALDGVHVSVSRSLVKEAPRMDADGYLTPLAEQELYRYYGLIRDRRAGVAPSTHSAPDDAMTRSEERLVVGTRSEEVGRARLRKYVVTENVTETVPVSHEAVAVRREAITDADMDEAMSDPAIGEAEHEVTLHAERPVVVKQTVPVERVRLATERVTTEEELNAEVRKEEIEVEVPERTDREI